MDAVNFHLASSLFTGIEFNAKGSPTAGAMGPLQPVMSTLWGFQLPDAVHVVTVHGSCNIEKRWRDP